MFFALSTSLCLCDDFEAEGWTFKKRELVENGDAYSERGGKFASRRVFFLSRPRYRLRA